MELLTIPGISPFGLIGSRYKIEVSLFKKTVKLEDFVHSLCGLVINSEPVGVLALKDRFSFEDLERIRDELGNFRFVILLLLLFDDSFRDKLSVSEEEMGRIIGKSIVLACRDSGLAPEKGKEWMGIYFEYLQEMLKNKQEEIAKKGLYFFACIQFASKILPNVNLLDESQRLKNFCLFDSAKQVYRSVNKAFILAEKSVRIEL